MGTLDLIAAESTPSLYKYLAEIASGCSQDFIFDGVYIVKIGGEIPMVERVCVICGERFLGRKNQKYCGSQCRAEGEKRNLITWRKRTGYNEKQKQSARQRREAIKKSFAVHPNRASRKKKTKYSFTREEMKNKAAAGDSVFKMYFMRNEKSYYFKKEYWEEYQRYILSRNSGKTETVNDIPITDPEFPEKVIEKIRHEGAIRKNI